MGIPLRIHIKLSKETSLEEWGKTFGDTARTLWTSTELKDPIKGGYEIILRVHIYVFIYTQAPTEPPQKPSQ